MNENPGFIDDVLLGKAKMTDAKLLEVFKYLDVMKDNVGKNPFDYETFGNGLG